ncbi:MAG TPA: hypothetical protein VIJ95_09085 [Hanamia sp.]
MKSFIYFIITILLTYFNGYGQSIKDSTGVYLTKQDFAANKLSYITSYRIKERFAELHSDFDYEAQGIILLKKADKKIVSFDPGKIYGFYSEGKKFLYVPAIKRYLFVLNEEPVTILMGEETTFYRYNTHTDLLLFYLNRKNELKRMNSENLNKDFNKENDILQPLLDIQKRFKERKNKKFNTAEFSKYIKKRFIKP